MKSSNQMKLLFGYALTSVILHGAVTIGPNITIGFEVGKSRLTEESESKLRDFVLDARKQGKIDEVKVAVWSDNPAPREGEELSKVDRELAENRLKAIEASLKHLRVSDVDTFNMAERASWLARVFHTEGAELKSELNVGKETPMFREEYNIFKNSGDSSKAVLVALVKHRK